MYNFFADAFQIRLAHGRNCTAFRSAILNKIFPVLFLLELGMVLLICLFVSIFDSIETETPYTISSSKW